MLGVGEDVKEPLEYLGCQEEGSRLQEAVSLVRRRVFSRSLASPGLTCA